VERTDRQTRRHTDRHDGGNSRFSQILRMCPKMLVLSTAGDFLYYGHAVQTLVLTKPNGTGG